MKHRPFEPLTKLSDISPVLTAHGVGQKFIFRSNNEMQNASTQIAYGVFQAGEMSESHMHSTMFEYFFFIKGKGTYEIDGVKFSIVPNTFIEIPASTIHRLLADKGERLEFVYWGIAVNQ